MEAKVGMRIVFLALPVANVSHREDASSAWEHGHGVVRIGSPLADLHHTFSNFFLLFHQKSLEITKIQKKTLVRGGEGNGGLVNNTLGRLPSE